MDPRELFTALLDRLGVNATEVAERSGKRNRQAALSKWLRNPAHQLSVRTAAPVARALGVPTAALLTEEGAAQAAAALGLCAAPGARPAQILIAAQRPVEYQPLSLAAAVARVRTALLAVPEDQRVAAAMMLIGQLGNSTIAPGTVAATLEAAASKRRRA